MRISDWSSDVCSSDLQTGNVAQRGNRVVVVKMATKTTLITQPGDAHHHRIAILVVGEELQRTRIAANLVAGIVELGHIARQSVVQGKSVSVRVDLSGRRIAQKDTVEANP